MPKMVKKKKTINKTEMPMAVCPTTSTKLGLKVLTTITQPVKAVIKAIINEPRNS